MIWTTISLVYFKSWGRGLEASLKIFKIEGLYISAYTSRYKAY